MNSPLISESLNWKAMTGY
jgi:hypothetical protein